MALTAPSIFVVLDNGHDLVMGRPYLILAPLPLAPPASIALGVDDRGPEHGRARAGGQRRSRRSVGDRRSRPGLCFGSGVLTMVVRSS